MPQPLHPDGRPNPVPADAQRRDFILRGAAAWPARPGWRPAAGPCGRWHRPPRR
ncbi:hypothetical protein WJ971_01350 [Achromobacter xylosoxidans]